MKKAIFLVMLFLLSLGTPMLLSVQAEDPSDEMSILHTAVNPSNNNTYHLLSASSWEDAASYARSLGGFLTTVDDEVENTWLFDTFTSWGDQSRHLWIGLSDTNAEGEYRWHDGTPFLYRNWGEAQPSAGGDEDYVHIASTNMGNIDPSTWNDLENDPQYFPVYGVVEIGPGADYALRFDGESDHIVVDQNDHTELNNLGIIHLSAWVNPAAVEGRQFIMMKGDYGWGMYLDDDRLAFSSEYSYSQHPVSNGTVEAGTWSLVEVIAEVGYGYSFFVNGADAGLVLDDDAQIPVGNFGSNSCYDAGLDCDEFYIARMGAGCDCGYFEGLLDNVSISVSASTNASDMIEISRWMFGEGEGSQTTDSTNQTGIIHGADWVMPDGSIVAQAVELFMGEEYTLEEASDGDTLLFFAEVEPYTRSLNWFSSSWKFDDWGDLVESMFDIYVGYNEIPDEWNHDDAFSDEFGFSFEQWDWPDEGTVWFVVKMKADVSEVVFALDAVVADPPPTLDEMTELKESIAVTNQDLFSGNGNNNNGYEANFYYVNVTEPLADLRVRTYGGRGNVDLGISYYSPPTPDDWFGISEPIFEDGGKEGVEVSTLSMWSTQWGNDEEVHLFDIEPGIYYITAYTYRNAQDFTIIADFVYPPENVEPEDAITLTPGVEYGILSGYEGLSQYFKVEVPDGTERLIVDLNDGEGEASLYMRLDQAPTSETYDHHSTTDGSDDRIAFNDPSPGWWYILLETESVFTGVNIIAEFADRFVWEYDGTPIELFNEEPIEGISIGDGGSINFFAMLEEPAEFLEVETYGGSGDLSVLIEGVQYQIEFNEGGRPNQGMDLQTTSEDATIKSGSDGTNHVVYFDTPMNGRVDVTLFASSDVEEVSIVAFWEETGFPIDPIEPDQPTKAVSCTDLAKRDFADADSDGSGTLEAEEIGMGSDDMITSVGPRILMIYDQNEDGLIEYREFLQVSCTCENELMVVFDAFSNGGWQVPIKTLDSHPWENEYDFASVDANKDAYLDMSELELLMVLCTTTFDAFDTDGDGVPDEIDAFPEDPKESKDTDGDGVGDNSDIVASVSNDIIYASAGLLFFVLAGLMFTFLRTGRDDAPDNKIWDDQDRMSEAMFNDSPQGMDLPAPASSIYDEESITTAPMSGPNPEAGAYEFANSISESGQKDPPSIDLMGMMSDGLETVEYPPGSGSIWVRTNPDEVWQPKA